MKETREIAAALAKAQAEGRVAEPQRKSDCTAQSVPGTEKEFMAAVVGHAKARGWLCYHSFDSRKCEPGFPDLFLLRGKEKLAAELKVGNNAPTAEQQNWLDAFEAAEVPAYVWRPEDWATIEETLR